MDLLLEARGGPGRLHDDLDDHGNDRWAVDESAADDDHDAAAGVHRVRLGRRVPRHVRLGIAQQPLRRGRLRTMLCARVDSRLLRGGPHAVQRRSRHNRLRAADLWRKLHLLLVHVRKRGLVVGG